MTDDVDVLALLAREVLVERRAALIAEACAWAVGLSDRPHHARRHGRVAPTGVTLGVRALQGQPLGSDEDAPLELGEARPGSFRDALAALTPEGGVHAHRFEREVLGPFVLDTCLLVLQRARHTHREALVELLDDVGADGSDPVEVVRAMEWEAPLTLEAELMALAALGDAPLVEVEAEGLPLSLVRAAEQVTRDAAPAMAREEPGAAEELAGALFLAEAALSVAGLREPVPPQEAKRLLEVLLGEGLEPDEVLQLLPHLPVQQDTAEEVGVLLEARGL